MRRSFIIRIRLIMAAIILFALLLIARLYVVQIAQGQEYQERAEAQYVSSGNATDERHSIFFKDKNGMPQEAAVMESGSTLAINPTQIVDAGNAYAALNAVTPIDHDRFMASAAKAGDPYEEIATKLPNDTAAAIQKLKIPGVLLAQSKWRVYPAAERAANVIGFIGYRDEEHQHVGVYGLEQYWQDTLMGASGIYVNFFAELFSSIGALTGSAHNSSGDIITSIEPTVEQHLETTLAQVEDAYHSKLTGGIIIDPRNGSVIAMASNPTFDPNTFNTVSDPSVFTNPNVQSVYELGSIMKALTMASGIDSGAITASSTYEDTGCIERDGAKVCNYDGKARGHIDMQEILNQSLNVGAAHVAETMGADTFKKYMLALGFGEETGIDLPGEVHGIVGALSSRSTLDLASASFGQGIAVTPIEMARALGALANHGIAETPHVADQIRLDTGISRSAWQKDERRVFTEQTTNTVTNMLIHVVDTALLKGQIKQEHYSIAAKTGTAQIAKPGGGYYPDRYLHSFFGYFPAHDPRFLILLYTAEPQGVSYASQTLTQPFADLENFLISYYNIPPDR